MYAEIVVVTPIGNICAKYKHHSNMKEEFALNVRSIQVL